jgi:hypothetical protein
MVGNVFVLLSVEQLSLQDMQLKQTGEIKWAMDLYARCAKPGDASRR